MGVSVTNGAPEKGRRYHNATAQTNGISTVTFVWLNQRLTHHFAGDMVRAIADCGCYPISTRHWQKAAAMVDAGLT